MQGMQAPEEKGATTYIKGGALPRQATAEATSEALLAEFEPEALRHVSKNCQLQLTTALLHSLVERLAMRWHSSARVSQA